MHKKINETGEGTRGALKCECQVIGFGDGKPEAFGLINAF